MENIILKKENGEVKIVNMDADLLHALKSCKVNPCFTCKNGYASKCQKIFDDEKKNIANYDFITDGYQVNNGNGIAEKLVVSNCINFEKDDKREKAKTKEELIALTKLKESIKILYFGGADIEEADQIQSDLIRRGLISDVENTENNCLFLKKTLK